MSNAIDSLHIHMEPDLGACTSAAHLYATFSACPNIAQLMFEFPLLNPFAHISRCLCRYEVLEREMKSGRGGDRLDGRLVVDFFRFIITKLCLRAKQELAPAGRSHTAAAVNFLRKRMRVVW